MGDIRKIGFVGMGKMGTPMSKNLLQAGFQVTVYNRTAAKTEELRKAGAGVATSMSALAADSEVVISMVYDDTSLHDVALGPEGILEGARPGLIYIDMSTVSPSASSRVADAAGKKGVKFLRAPVVGSTPHAVKGQLMILVSGPKDAYDGCGSVFGAMGAKHFHLGEEEQSRYMKLTINLLVGITSAMTAEALAFGERGGLDRNALLDIINAATVCSPLIAHKTPMLREDNFPPQFTVSQIAKDFDIAMNVGRDLNMPMPVTALVRQYLGAMKAAGKGDWDFFSLVTLWEELGKIKK